MLKIYVSRQPACAYKDETTAPHPPTRSPSHPPNHPPTHLATQPPTYPWVQAVMNGVDEVAVKRVRAETPSPTDLALFSKEVATLHSLRHRNIVQVGQGGGGLTQGLPEGHGFVEGVAQMLAAGAPGVVWAA
jgi:hypothetical protein